MKIKGNGYIHFYEPVDECPHEPTPEPLWQESWVIYFWDTKEQVYVYLRLGQEPNRGAGYAVTWLNIWTPSGVYKRTESSIALKRDSRTATTLVAGDGLCTYSFDGDHKWTVRDADVDLRLTLRDHHPGVGYFPHDSGALVDETARHHIEATGWTTGTVTIKGHTYTVAGISWRDHSWGPRNWTNIRAHRFTPALFGPEFNLFNGVLMGADGRLAKFAAIVRDGTVEVTTDFDVIAYMEEDAISNRGGRIILRLDGGTHEIEFTPRTKTIVSLHQDFHCVNAMCEVTMDGRTGVGAFETSNRAQGGGEKPFVKSSSILQNGVHPAQT